MQKILINRRQLEIAYEDQGSGEPLVLLHGFPFDREMWWPQVRGLSNEYRLLAPDFPGFGESSSPNEGFTVESLADIIADFIDAIGITGAVVVAGLSMGGYVALAFARQQPQRLRGLILADTKAEPDDEAAKAGRDQMSTVAREEGAAGVVERMLPKLVSDETRSQRPAVLDEARRIASRQAVPAIIHALLALRERPDATSGLGQITVPTLILVGEHDAITPPRCAFSMAEHILGATQVTIPGVGHLSNLEAPEAFNEQVRRFIHHPKK